LPTGADDPDEHDWSASNFQRLRGAAAGSLPGRILVRSATKFSR